jgi:acetyltransferase-like isoleucine patch superfamily enzyme
VDENKWIGARSPEFRAIFERIKLATRLSSEPRGYCMDKTESIRSTFEELLGKPVGDKVTLIPPFYADYGLNISVGRSVFIGYQCMFTGHGTIDIADEVMIANKVNLVTAGHPVDLDKRRAYITVEPITIETNVWIGSSATVLPAVTVGADSVVAAGAVVTHDVPPSDCGGGSIRDCRTASAGPSALGDRLPTTVRFAAFSSALESRRLRGIASRSGQPIHSLRRGLLCCAWAVLPICPFWRRARCPLSRSRRPPWSVRRPEGQKVGSGCLRPSCRGVGLRDPGPPERWIRTDGARKTPLVALRAIFPRWPNVVLPG